MKKLSSLILAALILVTLGACHSSKKLAQQQHKDLEEVFRSLKAEMPEATITMEGEKVKVVLPESVLFAKNSADINKDYLPILDKMARVLNKYDKTSILISGYTDITGTETYNTELSRKRAENAKQVFVTDKISAARIYTWGRGTKDPVADNSTEAGRKQNRRVEYIIMYDYKPEQ